MQDECKKFHPTSCCFKFLLQNGLYILIDIPVGCL